MNALTRYRKFENVRTILVVDHDVALRKGVAQLLRDCGYRVVEAANTNEASTILQESSRQLDVVLSRIDIPGQMNGFGFAQWARSIRPELKIMLAGTTARTLQNVAELCEVGPLGGRYEQALMLERIKRVLART